MITQIKQKVMKYRQRQIQIECSVVATTLVSSSVQERSQTWESGQSLDHYQMKQVLLLTAHFP